MTCRPRRIGLLVGLFLLLASPASVEAQDDSLDLRWQILEQKARKSVLEAEMNIFDRHKERDLPQGKKPGADLLADYLFDEWSASKEKCRICLLDAAAPVRKHAEAVKSTWYGESTQKLTLEALKEEAEREIEKAQKVSLWDSGTVWIIICGIGLVAASVLLSVHGRRRQLRSYVRFNGKMGVASVALFVLVGWLATISSAQDKDAAINQLAALKRETKELQDRADQDCKTRLETIARLFPEPDRRGFVDVEQEAVRNFRNLMCEAKHLELANEDSKKIENENKEIEKKLDEKKAKLAEKRAEVGVSRRWNGGIKIGLCLAFVFIAYLPLRRLERTQRSEREKQADQCPCCLANGSLEQKKSPVQDKRFPEPVYVNCAECGYLLRPSYLNHPRLCFPTVGVRGSGKTHWLVSAYDLIKRKKSLPTSVTVHTAPSVADEEFEIQIEQILDNHMKARGTVHNPLLIPAPLVFKVEDSDRLGKNEAMLNLFDFSGEMTHAHVDTDVLRRRALLMDGFVLFIDPTQVIRSKANNSLKNQIQALESFHQEIRDMRNVDVGTPVPAPVAVCISKLDLITTQSPLSQAALPWIRELRESFAKPLSLAEMQKRSKLCEQVLASLFPGWNLTRILDEQFGGRFQFFPLTPVGLEETELGQDDLTRRTFTSVGVLEPILWLMHMHGYKVFG